MNFVHVNTCMKDVDLFLNGPPWNEDVIFNFFTNKETLAHLMFRAGIFTSISQAKKNGWDKPVPNGFSEFFIGKKKFGIWIIK